MLSVSFSPEGWFHQLNEVKGLNEELWGNFTNVSPHLIYLDGTSSSHYLYGTGGREKRSLTEVCSSALLPPVVPQRWKVIINRLRRQQPLSTASSCRQAINSCRGGETAQQNAHARLSEGDGPADREKVRIIHGDRGAAAQGMALSTFPGTRCLCWI